MSLRMKIPKRYGWSAAAAAVGVLAACASLQFEGSRPMPGNGPNGAPLRSASEVAVGLNPAPANPPVYPLTFRLAVKDRYHGVTVEDPYRWLEDLDSDATHRWVADENRLSQPRLEAIPHRPWLKQRLAQLWNYERYDIPAKEGGHYFYLHNDGRQNQSVLLVADRADSPGRVLFDPNAVSTD